LCQLPFDRDEAVRDAVRGKKVLPLGVLDLANLVIDDLVAELCKQRNQGGVEYRVAVSSQRRNGSTSKRLERRFVCDAGEMARGSI
jgi:hypothetical protein